MSNTCGIKFYLRIKIFTIQIFWHNQLLTILKQDTKQYTISNQTYMTINLNTWIWIIELVLRLIDPMWNCFNLNQKDLD